MGLYVGLPAGLLAVALAAMYYNKRKVHENHVTASEESRQSTLRDMRTMRMHSYPAFFGTPENDLVQDDNNQRYTASPRRPSKRFNWMNAQNKVVHAHNTPGDDSHDKMSRKRSRETTHDDYETMVARLSRRHFTKRRRTLHGRPTLKDSFGDDSDFEEEFDAELSVENPPDELMQRPYSHTGVLLFSPKQPQEMKRSKSVNPAARSPVPSSSVTDIPEAVRGRLRSSASKERASVNDGGSKPGSRQGSSPILYQLLHFHTPAEADTGMLPDVSHVPPQADRASGDSTLKIYENVPTENEITQSELPSISLVVGSDCTTYEEMAETKSILTGGGSMSDYEFMSPSFLSMSPNALNSSEIIYERVASLTPAGRVLSASPTQGGHTMYDVVHTLAVPSTTHNAGSISSEAYTIHSSSQANLLGPQEGLSD